VSEWLIAAYPWLKSFHIVGVIAWMAGLLYLPRLYVYHAGVPAGSDQTKTFEVMERRLLHGIMAPAIAVTYIFGVMLAATPGVVDWPSGWIWSKLALVVLLTGFHLLLARWRRGFVTGRYPHSARFFRAVNELPAVAMIAIVVFVVVKPF
jgi:putative membrane protein